MAGGLAGGLGGGLEVLLRAGRDLAERGGGLHAALAQCTVQYART